MVHSSSILPISCLSLALLLGISAMPCNAQSTTEPAEESPPERFWYVAAHPGINVTTLDGNPALRATRTPEQRAIFETGTGVDMRLAAGVGRQFSPYFALDVELALDRHTVSNSGATRDTVEYVDERGFPTGQVGFGTVNRSFTVAVTYIALSVHGRAAIGPIFIFAGPTVLFPTSQSVRETIRLDGTARYHLGTPEETAVIVGELFESDASLRVSLTLGAGLTIGVSRRLEIMPRVGYELATGGTFDSRGEYVFTRPVNARSYFTEDFNKDVLLNSLFASVGVRYLLGSGSRSEQATQR